MHPIVALVIVLGVILGFLAALLILGLSLARRFSRRTPNSRLSEKIKATDVASLGLMVMALVTITTARQLAPETPLGALLNTPIGFVAALVCAWIATIIVHVAIVMLVRLAHKWRGA